VFLWESYKTHAVNTPCGQGTEFLMLKYVVHMTLCMRPAIRVQPPTLRCVHKRMFTSFWWLGKHAPCHAKSLSQPGLRGRLYTMTSGQVHLRPLILSVQLYVIFKYDRISRSFLMKVLFLFLVSPFDPHLTIVTKGGLYRCPNSVLWWRTAPE
jgi:hypothetical protein